MRRKKENKVSGFDWLTLALWGIGMSTVVGLAISAYLSEQARTERGKKAQERYEETTRRAEAASKAAAESAKKARELLRENH